MRDKDAQNSSRVSQVRRPARRILRLPRERGCVPFRSVSAPTCASDHATALWLASPLRLETSRARAPAKASTWRGGSPRQAEVHPPVTEGYCVVATRGGELPEVNNPSVTQHHARHEAT